MNLAKLDVYEIHACSLNDLPLSNANKLMDMYVKRGSMADAHHVFKNMPQRDVVSWNILILGYARQEEGALALEWYVRMHQEGVQPTARTFVAALKACNSLPELKERKRVDGKDKKTGCLEKGRVIHSRIVKRGLELNVFTGTTLVDMYAKSGSIEDARHVFDKLTIRNLVSWTAMIQGYSSQDEGPEALELYARMQQEAVTADERTFVGVLKACSSLAASEEEKQVNGKSVKVGSLEKGRGIHSQVIMNGCESDEFVGTTLVDVYTKCGSMEDARRVFDKLLLLSCNAVTWNAMILGYSKQEGMLGLDLYARMCQKGIAPDDRTFVGVLKACSSLAALEERDQVNGRFMQMGCMEKGRALHSHVVKGGFESYLFVGTTLIDLYAKCGSMEDAQCSFDELPRHDVVSWNAMLLGYSKQVEGGVVALKMYAQMKEEGVTADDGTFVAVLKACSSLADQRFMGIEFLEKARAIHSQAMKCGFESNEYVGNTLADTYSTFESMEDAWCIFDKLPHRNVVSWNTMILGYSKQEEGMLALGLYAQMQQEGFTPDDRTFFCAMKACGSLAAVEEGKQIDGKFVKKGCLEKVRTIHSLIAKSGFETDIFIGDTLVDVYAKCGNLKDARCVFAGLAYRDVFTWTTMILGYVEQEESEEALKLYALMQEQGLLADSWAFVATLKACGNIAALATGNELHFQISKAGFETITVVASSLIDMYGRCASMVDAQQLFDALPTRDVLIWSSLIAGYARQGECEVVFHLVERMRQEGLRPDRVTFLSVLTACSHVGLVDKGQRYFQAMSKQCDIIPTIQHYSCMVNLLCRAGQLDEALELAEKMPFQPNVVIWLTMLGACQKWKHVEVGRHAFDNLVGLDEKLPAAYILMSNIL